MSRAAPRPVFITNTLSGKREEIKTIESGKLRFYSCGPTVYNYIHIGNLRAGLVSDLIYRYFKKIGYDVTFVRNYTDVDDRIIAQSIEEKIPTERVTQKYIAAVDRDYALAGMEAPTRKTLVTQFMSEIISMIEQILQNGHAYVAEDGEVLFSVESFPSYGRLSRKKLDDLVAGARVEVSSKKKNPMDFALWKPAKPGEPFWESPWGAGRPGWHIECSAMASTELGEQIDLHHGGEDLIFPHHENEIAQSESACGKAPFSRYWMHNGFLNMREEKMSKSLGNVLLAKDFLQRYNGEIARCLLFSAQYRHPLNFDDSTVAQALSMFERIYDAKSRARKIAAGGGKAVPDLRAENAWGSFVAECEETRRKIDDELASDLNTPGAFGALFTLIRGFNRTLESPGALATPGAILGAAEFLRLLEQDFGGVLGIGLMDPEKALADLTRIRREAGEDAGKTRPTAEEIEALITQRLEARKAKNFAEADRIRDELLAKGVVLKDSPQGTTWSYQ